MEEEQLPKTFTKFLADFPPDQRVIMIQEYYDYLNTQNVTKKQTAKSNAEYVIRKKYNKQRQSSKKTSPIKKSRKSVKEDDLYTKQPYRLQPSIRSSRTIACRNACQLCHKQCGVVPSVRRALPGTQFYEGGSKRRRKSSKQRKRK